MLTASCSSTRPAPQPSGFWLPGGLGTGRWLLERNGQTVTGAALSQTPVFVRADPGTYEVFIICAGADLPPHVPVVVLRGKPQTVAVPVCLR